MAAHALAAVLRQAEDVRHPDLRFPEGHGARHEGIADLETTSPCRYDAIVVARDEEEILAVVHVCLLCRAAAVSVEGVESLEIGRARAPEDHLAKVVRHRRAFEGLAYDHEPASQIEAPANP